MNILIFEHKTFGIEDVKESLGFLGHSYKVLETEDLPLYESENIDALFNEELSKASYDAVFTFNFSPTVSENCKKHGLPYISYVYDSPQVLLYSYMLINPCNKVYIFDKAMYEDFKKSGIGTVYYMPLAVNQRRLSKQTDSFLNKNEFMSDVTFVGSMYNEAHNLYDRLDTISKYTKGYLEGIMDAQLKVYGDFFIEKLLTPEILEDLQNSVPYVPDRKSAVKPEYVYANYFIGRKLTNIERTTLLSEVSNKFKVDLYTKLSTPDLKNVNNHGPIDYYDKMPEIFAKSKINLNITLRSIRSGIPLRAMDILGCGGFLLSNYQADFFDFFNPGEDLVLYDSKDDLLDKCDYYLKHDEERIKIARSGMERVRNEYNYDIILGEMLKNL